MHTCVDNSLTIHFWARPQLLLKTQLQDVSVQRSLSTACTTSLLLQATDKDLWVQTCCRWVPLAVVACSEIWYRSQVYRVLCVGKRTQHACLVLKHDFTGNHSIRETEVYKHGLDSHQYSTHERKCILQLRWLDRFAQKCYLIFPDCDTSVRETYCREIISNKVSFTAILSFQWFDCATDLW